MPLAMFHSADTSGRSVFCEIEPIEHSHESENKHLIHLREGLLYSGPHKIRLSKPSNSKENNSFGGSPQTIQDAKDEIAAVSYSTIFELIPF